MCVTVCKCLLDSFCFKVNTSVLSDVKSSFVLWEYTVSGYIQKHTQLYITMRRIPNNFKRLQGTKVLTFLIRFILAEVGCRFYFRITNRLKPLPTIILLARARHLIPTTIRICSVFPFHYCIELILSVFLPI